MDPTVAAMTPEERLAHNLCAECGAPLTGIDVTHHSMQHWTQWIRPDGTNAEAIRRQGLMSDYAAAHPPAATRPAETKTSSSSSPPPHARS